MVYVASWVDLAFSTCFQLMETEDERLFEARVGRWQDRRSSAAWTQIDGDAEAWDVYVVDGHFIHGEETDWLPRAEIILQYGQARPFEPFDRLAQFDRFKDQTLAELLDTFADLRRQNLAKLKAMQLTDTQLRLRGTHPELGPATLGQLLAAWVVHDLNHIGQIVEAMAKGYSQAVGPWRAYLPILDR